MSFQTLKKIISDSPFSPIKCYVICEWPFTDWAWQHKEMMKIFTSHYHFPIIIMMLMRTFQMLIQIQPNFIAP